MIQDPIYLDFSASTPVDPTVYEAMKPYWAEQFGNPSSQHSMGWKAEMAVERARQSVASLLGASSSKEVVFTSGASEANSLALLGSILALKTENPQGSFHALTSAVEHKSVLKTFEQLKILGVSIDIIKPNRYGQVDIKEIEAHLRPETVLMSFMAGNNELGSFNPIQEISALARKHQICFHCDATQLIGKIPLNLQETPIDFLSLSGHKMYGPKGIGALYTRRENKRLAFPLFPLIQGGGHEHGLRAGTVNVCGVVGLGQACEVARTQMAPITHDLKFKTDYLLKGLREIFPNVRLNGHPEQRLPGHLHLTFQGIRWDQWLPRMSHLCVSSTSACNAGSNQGSHVLDSLGFSADETAGSLRLSLGKTTTHSDLDRALALFEGVFKAQSRFSLNPN